MGSKSMFRYLSTVFTLIVLSAVSAFADPLQGELAELANKSFANASPERIKVMADAQKALADSDILSHSPKVGSMLPDATLKDVAGQSVTLYDAIGNGAAIVTFYRGGWCPYCNLQLHAFSQRLGEIRALGAKLVAISPELPDATLTTSEKNKLEYSVLSDVENQYAERLGIVHTLHSELQALYKGFGIDLEKNQGNAGWRLPLAATFVVDSARIIRYAFVEIDYKKRADIDRLIAELKAIDAAKK